LLAPLLADIVAVGVPLLILVTANLEEDVADEPSRKSCEVFLSYIAPNPCSNGEPPFTTGRIPVTSAVRST